MSNLINTNYVCDFQAMLIFSNLHILSDCQTPCCKITSTRSMAPDDIGSNLRTYCFNEDLYSLYYGFFIFQHLSLFVDYVKKGVVAPLTHITQTADCPCTCDIIWKNEGMKWPWNLVFLPQNPTRNSLHIYKFWILISIGYFCLRL